MKMLSNNSRFFRAMKPGTVWDRTNYLVPTKSSMGVVIPPGETVICRVVKRHPKEGIRLLLERGEDRIESWLFWPRPGGGSHHVQLPQLDHTMKKAPYPFKQIKACPCGNPGIRNCIGGGGVCQRCHDIEQRNVENMAKHKRLAVTHVRQSNDGRVRHVKEYRVGSVMSCV